MAVVPIRIVGDPALHTPTTPVPVAADGSLPADLAGLISTMYDTMDAAHGVGLAANQIGHGLRLFVYDCAEERVMTDRRRGVVINPVLEKALSPELVMDFRSAFFERRKRLAQALAAALPGADAEEIFPLTLHIFTHVAGLWPLCHPSSESEKLLEDPEHAHLNLNFEIEMTRFLLRLLK